jgi:glutamate-1-semialdehyde 2,1-aminomutase
VYQAGTLSGNPVAVAAGRETLRKLAAPGVYEKLEQLGQRVEAAFRAAAKAAGVALTVQRVGSMLTPFFSDAPVRSWDDAKRCDTVAFGKVHNALIKGGVHWPPSQFEAGFVSLAHDETALAKTEGALREAFKAV